MTTTNTPPVAKTQKSILELSREEASQFLLKPESYCSVDLPPYIGFGPQIGAVRSALGDLDLNGVSTNPRDHQGVNHSILTNKDGKYSWRAFELIHPALYVSLVRKLTSKNNWELIIRRFKELSANGKLICLSHPVVSSSGQSDKAEQIHQWWSSVEQRSIELSLEFEYLIDADITDCYGSIYTHSIAWALHGKQFAKDNRRDTSLLGNLIDKHIQDMRYGQTNGIPQGSVLMDFIAEMVLGLIDVALSERIAKAKIDDYRILRYRDDYRIFTNNPYAGAQIVKLLSEATLGIGLKLNAAKSRSSSDVVRSSIKADKLAWVSRKQSEQGLQKHLLIIHDHASQFPNAGSLLRALGDYHKRVLVMKELQDPIPLIAIVVDIAFRNPRTHAVCAAILSILFRHVETQGQKVATINKIKNRFSQIPNTGLMQIWLQRVTYPLDRAIRYEEPLCSLVSGDVVQIWNSDWIIAGDLKRALNSTKIIDKERLEALDPTISTEEIDLFAARALSGYY